jgi:hypothetical protein
MRKPFILATPVLRATEVSSTQRRGKRADDPNITKASPVDHTLFFIGVTAIVSYIPLRRSIYRFVVEFSFPTIALKTWHRNTCSSSKPTQLADLHKSQLVIEDITPGIYLLVRIAGRVLPYSEYVTAWIMRRQLADLLDDPGWRAGQYSSCAQVCVRLSMVSKAKFISECDDISISAYKQSRKR